MSTNQERERIVSRLHEIAGVCSHCGARKCPHGTNTVLPHDLRRSDVLQAINLDNHFEGEPDHDGHGSQ